MKKYTIIISLILFGLLKSQVGINKTNPTETLDVNGNMQLSENLYLENPGIYTGASVNSYLVVKDNANNVLKRYVPETADYSAINSVIYTFLNVNFAGLTDYDTKIATSDYYVTIGGYIIRGGGDSSNVYIDGSNEYIPMYSARAFESNGTWHLQFVPNSERQFTVPANSPQNIEIRLNVVIYRKDMLTTVNPTINFNMGANPSGTGTAPIPEKM